jgi:Arm DNA-binding domain
MKLTDKFVEHLVLLEGKSERLVFDESLPGFGVRLRAGGKRTWIAQYRTASQQRRLTLGDFAKIDAAQARKLAREALAKVQLGQDPQGEKATARVPKAQEMTLGETIERYLPFAQRRLKPSTYSGVVLHLKKHWRALHPEDLKNVERRHVAAEVGRIATTSGLYGANRSRAALSTLFS